MINVAEIILDPDFAQLFSILRSTGTFVAGEFQTAITSTIPVYGIVEVASPQEILEIPEADQVVGMMKFLTTVPILETRNSGGSEGVSDVIQWKGQNYRIVKLEDWSSYGYWRSFGVRTAGD